MGGCSVDDDWEFPNSTKLSNTVVLVGRTGNGKSATGNSILGKRAFKSRASSSGVTTTTEMESTVLKDGRTVNVIDTPGLFEFSKKAEFIGNEIVKCINLAKDGIHAVLVVFSIRGRFSKEEEASLQGLQNFFGPRITDYMIVIFTGGDELEDGDTLDDYLGRECPKPLQKILDSCDKRVLLFDNKTKDARQEARQVQKLFSIVDGIMEKNNGRPYSDEIFAELKKGDLKLQEKSKEVEFLEGHSKQKVSELQEQMYKTYDEQLKRITEMVEVKIRETTHRFEQQLAAEQAAREQAEKIAREAEKIAREAQRKSDDEIRKLRESLEKARKETEELRQQAGGCAIL